jgi:hypothetical protein
MQNVVITQQLTLKDFLRFRLDMIFKNIFLKVFFGFLILTGIIPLIGLIIDPENETGNLSTTLIYFVIILALPAFILIQARSSFQSHKSLHEKMTYIFSTEGIQVNGESFSTNSNWTAIVKVRETRKRILLFQSNNLANILLKKNMSSDDLLRFREMVSQIQGLKVKLRK